MNIWPGPPTGQDVVGTGTRHGNMEVVSVAQDAGVNCVCFCWRRDAGDQQEGCGGEPHYPGGGIGITGRADV